MDKKICRWLRFNALYMGRPPWDTGTSPPELLNFLIRTPPGRGLDLGCGTGTNLLTMAKQGWQVVGVDFALLSVLRARWKLRRHRDRPRVIWGDVTHLQGFDAPFQLVLDMGCFHGLNSVDRKIYRQNLTRWLAPGGTFLIYAHRRFSGADHGIDDTDILAFQKELALVWREDSGEARPGGGGGRPATWARFDAVEV